MLLSFCRRTGFWWWLFVTCWIYVKLRKGKTTKLLLQVISCKGPCCVLTGVLWIYFCNCSFYDFKISCSGMIRNSQYWRSLLNPYTIQVLIDIRVEPAVLFLFQFIASSQFLTISLMLWMAGMLSGSTHDFWGLIGNFWKQLSTSCLSSCMKHIQEFRFDLLYSSMSHPSVLSRPRFMILLEVLFCINCHLMLLV